MSFWITEVKCKECSFTWGEQGGVIGTRSMYVGVDECPQCKATVDFKEYTGNPAPGSEKTEFDVILVSVKNDRRVGTIRALREMTGLSLNECLDMINKVPTTVISAIDKEECGRWKNAFDDVANLEIK